MQKRAQQSVHWTLGILRNFGVDRIIRDVVEYSHMFQQIQRT